MHGSVGTQSNGFALGANHYTYAGLFETLRSQDQVPFSLALESPFSASFVHILKPRGSSTKLEGKFMSLSYKNDTDNSYVDLDNRTYYS